MRMHKKGHLAERLESCKDILLVNGTIDKNLKRMEEEYRSILDFSKIFGNDHPVCLEFGCGNGAFCIQLALSHPEWNILAVERMSNVIITALENAKKYNLPNLRFLNLPVEVMRCYISEQSIQTIYLNFSTPLPEKSREKQRLTSDRFIKIYRSLLKTGGHIEQKTDSMHFFEYSLEQFSKNQFVLKNISLDLHHSDYTENIVTEYERKFSQQGMPIYRLEAYIL